MPAPEDSTITAFLGLLIAVAIVAASVRFVRLPYTIALVLTGLVLAVAPHAPAVQLTPNLILTVFLPVLLFHAAYGMDLAEVRANLTPVALLALPGVAITAALVGATLHLVAGFSWSVGLLFGTMVAATDPVAVLAVFTHAGAPRRLATIVNAESIFNDGTALVLFATMLGVVTTRTVSVAITVEQLVVAVSGSLILGSIVALAGGTVLARIDDALLETTITLIMAYGGFLLADYLSLSGPLETATAGLLLGARGRAVMSPTTRLQAGATWEFLDFVANSLLFLLMGLAVRVVGPAALSQLPGRVWWPLLVAVLAITVARACVVWLVSLVLARTRQALPRGWRLVLTWAGLRGAVSLAAALSLPAALPQRPQLLVLTFGVVLLTFIVQGLTMQPLLERLSLTTARSGRRDFEVALGRLHAVAAARRVLLELPDDPDIDEHLAQRLLAEYTERYERLRRRVDTLLHGNPAVERQQEYALVRRLLHAQRTAVRDAYARGVLSSAAQKELLDDLDVELSRLESLGG